MDKKREAKMRAKNKVDAKLTNFDISFVLDAQGQEKYYFRQASNDKATFFELRGRSREIDYADFVKKKAYVLNADEKTGESFPMEPVEAFKGLAFHTAGHLLFMHAGEDLKKIGKEKVLGRDTTVFSQEYNDGEMKSWVDDEYGLALKYEMTGGASAKMYVTEFTVGGVAAEKLIDLNEYRIE